MKKLLLLLFSVLLLSCEKNNPEPVAPTVANNPADTTTFIPVLIPNKLTCWLNGVYWESTHGTGITDGGEYWQINVNRGQTSTENYVAFFIDIPKGFTGVFNYSATPSVMSERRIGESNNRLYHRNYYLEFNITRNSNGVLEGTFWGGINTVNTSYDEYTIHSGKFNFSTP